MTVVVTLLVYDAVLVLTKPAVLPGLYAVVREQGSAAGLRAGLGRLATATRAHYADVAVALFVSRVAAYGYAVLLGAVAAVALLIGATAVSLGLYASGLADSIDPWWVEPTLLGGILAVRLAGQVPVSYADLLAVDGTRPRRAWLASRRLLGREPGAVRRGAVWRTILGATPVLAVILAMSVLATTPGTLVSVAAPATVLVVVGTFTKSLEGIVLVRRLGIVEGPDALARPRSTGGRGSTPGRSRPRAGRCSPSSWSPDSSRAAPASGWQIHDRILGPPTLLRWRIRLTRRRRTSTRSR